MKVILICNTDGALYLFRLPLIRALLALGHEVVSISSEGPYIGRLQEIGVRTHVVEFARHSVSPLQNLLLLFRLWRIVQAENPDVVHSFTHKAVIYGALAARLAHIPKIVTTITGLGTLFINDDRRSRLLRWALVVLYRLALSRRVTVLFQNPDDLRELVDMRMVRADQAILTHGSGIDLEEFALPSGAAVDDVRAALAVELRVNLEGKTVVLFPARCVREKGFVEFYEAARQIGRTYPDRFVFVHIGLIDSATAGHFTARDVYDSSRENGVFYLGFKDNVVGYMSAVDVVALPSYREGTPRSLIEALALGKVIITTDAPGCRETVVDGWNGYLCQPRSATSLADALIKVDATMITQARARSRHYCSEKYDVSKLIALTLSLYGMETGS
jgi:N,N'-diacetylbacillosaminyl-diphospho-undecaprenol alpha-1,3-N-acetylgalactosaminyltransferase